MVKALFYQRNEIRKQILTRLDIVRDMLAECAKNNSYPHSCSVDFDYAIHLSSLEIATYLNINEKQLKVFKKSIYIDVSQYPHDEYVTAYCRTLYKYLSYDNKIAIIPCNVNVFMSIDAQAILDTVTKLFGESVSLHNFSNENCQFKINEIADDFKINYEDEMASRAIVINQTMPKFIQYLIMHSEFNSEKNIEVHPNFLLCAHALELEINNNHVKISPDHLVKLIHQYLEPEYIDQKLIDVIKYITTNKIQLYLQHPFYIFVSNIMKVVCLDDIKIDDITDIMELLQKYEVTKYSIEKRDGFIIILFE